MYQVLLWICWTLAIKKIEWFHLILSSVFTVNFKRIQNNNKHINIMSLLLTKFWIFLECYLLFLIFYMSVFAKLLLRYLLHGNRRFWKPCYLEIFLKPQFKHKMYHSIFKGRICAKHYFLVTFVGKPMLTLTIILYKHGYVTSAFHTRKVKNNILTKIV